MRCRPRRETLVKPAAPKAGMRKTAPEHSLTGRTSDGTDPTSRTGRSCRDRDDHVQHQRQAGDYECDGNELMHVIESEGSGGVRVELRRSCVGSEHPPRDLRRNRRNSRDLLASPRQRNPRSQRARRHRHPHPHPRHGPSPGSVSRPVLRQRLRRPGRPGAPASRSLLPPLVHQER